MTTSSLAGFSETRHTAHEFVRETLRRAILSGALPEGTHLIQSDIAAQLSVSTTPVREALRDLVADGLAVSKPHVGTVVRGLDLDEFVELYELRKALEPIMVRKAAEEISEENLEKAARVQAELDRLTDEPAKWADANWRFHTIIDESVKSTLLAPMLKHLQEMAATYVAHSARTHGNWLIERNKEHVDLLEALRDRDADKAAEIIVRHLDITLSTVLSEHSPQ